MLVKAECREGAVAAVVMDMVVAMMLGERRLVNTVSGVARGTVAPVVMTALLLRFCRCLLLSY